MSWKSFLTAGLLCVLATPVFANPNLALVKGGTLASSNLDANGNWVWNVQITPDLSVAFIPDGSGTPVAAELGFTSTSNIAAPQGNVLGAFQLNPSTNFDTINPGSVIFPSWQTAGNGLLDAASNNRPTGIQTQCASGTCSTQSYTTPGGDSSVAGTPQQVFAALGSVNFTTPGPKDFIQITVQRPATTSASVDAITTIQVGGVYGAGNTNGRITQVTGQSGTTYTTSNFDTFGGATYSFTRRARAGDTNLDGGITGGDFAALQAAFNQNPGTNKWTQGDFNGDGNVTGGDFSLMQQNWGQTYTVGPVSPGAGSGLESGNVPEPASIALLGLALLGGLGVIRRKR